MLIPFSLILSRKNVFSATPREERCVYNASPCVSAEITESGDGYVYRTMRLFNDSNAESEQISAPLIVDATFPCTACDVHTLRGEDCTPSGFLPVDKTLIEGDELAFEPNGGRSSSTTAFPFFDITFGGRTLLFVVGWTGQWRVALGIKNGALSVRIGIRYADFFLYPGESLLLPSVLMLEAPTPEQARTSVRRALFQMAPKLDSLPVAISPFDRYFYGQRPSWLTEEGQLEVLEAAKKCGGFDTFWLDAAWFEKGFPTGVGNYRCSAGFPRGLSPVAKEVHKAGMKFVLWFEPERVYRGTDIYRDNQSFLLSSEISARLVDLGNEEAWQFTFDSLARLIEDFGVDIYRQDFNMDPLPFWLENDEPGRHGIREIKHVNGMYRLWDELRRRFPELIIDNCASGGRRIDVETLRRSVVLFRSDNGCFPRSAERPTDTIAQNQTLALGEYLPYQSCAVWEPVPYDIRSAATSGIVCQFDMLCGSFDFDTANKLLREVKRLAPYWQGDFHPLTKPTLDEHGFCAFTLSRENDGYVSVFRRPECEEETFSVRFFGIDENASYSLILTGEDMIPHAVTETGKTLAHGYTVRLPEKRTSLVIEYKKSVV